MIRPTLRRGSTQRIVRLSPSRRIGTASALLVFAVVVLLAPLFASAEIGPLTYEGPGGSAFTISGSYRGRAELADWFESGPPLDNSDYGFMGNRFQLGAGRA